MHMESVSSQHLDALAIRFAGEGGGVAATWPSHHAPRGQAVNPDQAQALNHRGGDGIKRNGSYSKVHPAVTEYSQVRATKRLSKKKPNHVFA